MSCWVVPAVAAELWGVAVNEVLAQIKRGTITSKSEYGFTLVDVAPESPKFQRSLIPAEPRPLTYKPASAPMPLALAEDDDVQDEELTEIEEGELNWRATRQSVSRLRRPPRVAQLAA